MLLGIATNIYLVPMPACERKRKTLELNYVKTAKLQGIQKYRQCLKANKLCQIGLRVRNETLDQEFHLPVNHL